MGSLQALLSEHVLQFVWQSIKEKNKQSVLYENSLSVYLTAIKA